MTDLNQILADLKVAPPEGLERATVFEAGAGDRVATTDSPFGPLWIAWSTRGITAVKPIFAAPTIDDFLDTHRRISYEAPTLPGTLEADVHAALTTGETEDIDLDLTGVSPFQQSVLEACSTIHVGSVRPYGWIAEEIHKPGATRAVGTALAKNPIPLLIPCHRVVRSDGAIGNYAFGAEMKRELLIREGAIAL